MQSIVPIVNLQELNQVDIFQVLSYKNESGILSEVSNRLKALTWNPCTSNVLRFWHGCDRLLGAPCQIWSYYPYRFSYSKP